MTEFAAMVKGAREDKAIRAYDLAFALGMAPSWLSKLEKGDLTHPPAPHILEGLSKELKIPQAQMLEALGYDVGIAGIVEQDPTDPKLEMIGLVKRIRMTQDRADGLRALLRGWLEADHQGKGKS